MNDSFIAGDVSLRKYKKLTSSMKKQVDEIEAVIGYRKQSPPSVSLKKQATMKQYKIRSRTLVENFTAMQQSFEDILKPIEDPVIREWMAKIDSESRSSSLNTVSVEFIHEFIIKIMRDFNEMMASSKLPSDTFAEAAKTRLDNFQKGQIVKEIEDSLANLATFVVLIDQINAILSQCKFLIGKDKISLQRLLEKYEFIVKRSSSNILGQIQKLLIYDLKSLLTQESKQLLLQKLKEIEDNLLTSDLKKDLQNYTSSVIETSNITSPQKVLFPSVAQNESPPRVVSQKPSFQGILMSHKNSVNYLAATGQSETFGVSPKISDKEAREKELREKIQNETNRIAKAGQLVKKCKGAEELQAMIKTLQDIGTVLALQDLIPKNSLEKHIYSLVQQQQQSSKIAFPKQFQAIIDNQKAVIVSAFSILESQGSQFNQQQQQQPQFRRYLGDGGMITHRHFLLNKDNLAPILKELDPVTFSEDPPESRVNLVKKQKEMTQKHIERIKKQKMSTSTFSSSTLTRGRNCTIKSNTNTDNLDVSQNSKIRGDRVDSSSSRTRFKSATNEGTQGQSKGRNDIPHEGKTLDYYKSLLASSGQIEQRGNSNASSIPGLNSAKVKDNLSSSVVLAKKRGLAEYFVHKNLSKMNQQILSAINQNFDASNMNEKLIKQDEEQKFLIDSSNRLPDIQQKRASILQSFNRKQQQIFNRSQANSMAECSQENSSSNDDSSSYLSLEEQVSIDQKSANQTGKIQHHSVHSDAQQQRHTLKFDIGQIYHEMPSNIKSTMILIENNSVDLHSLRRTEATSQLTSALNHSPYVKHKFIPRKSNPNQRSSEIKNMSSEYYDEDSIFARTDNKERANNPLDSVENAESKVFTSEEKESAQKEQVIEGNSIEKEFATPSKPAPKKRKSQLQNRSLMKRSEIIDRVNASFMPKYIHEHSSKVITKTNPQMLRYLLGSFKKREMELISEARENMHAMPEEKCYGVEELAFKPKDHNFYTSSLQSTYEDIKTTKILQHTNM